MGIINENHKRLVDAIDDELRKAQVDIERQRKQQVCEADDDDVDGDNDDDGDHDDEGQAEDADGAADNDGDDGDDECQEGHDDGQPGYEGYENDTASGTPITIVDYDRESPTEEEGPIEQ